MLGTDIETTTGTLIRNLRMEDLIAVSKLDAAYTGEKKLEYWSRVFRDFLQGSDAKTSIGIAAVQEGVLTGFLLGETRAFEFGSEVCGWVFSVGVDPERARGGIATAMLQEARRRFREAGVSVVRTMVEKNNIPVLSFFRSSGFTGGSFHQLEIDLNSDPNPEEIAS